MNKSNKSSPDVGERAVRTVQERRRGEPDFVRCSRNHRAPKIGCVPLTLLECVKYVEVDGGVFEGVISTEAHRVKGLDWTRS